MIEDEEPDEDVEICPFCGAYSPLQCELEDDAGVCPWEAMGENGTF